MTAAGGLYSSAADLARFLRFAVERRLDRRSGGARTAVDGGAADGARRRMPDAPAGYALGVVRHRWNRWGLAPDLFNHGGGGYGFLSDLWWVPQLGLGIAILTNSADHELQEEPGAVDARGLVTQRVPDRDRLVSAAVAGRR